MIDWLASRAWYDLKYTLDTDWIHSVQLGPSPNRKHKPWFWTKANTKVTFNTPTHSPTKQTFQELDMILNTHWIHIGYILFSLVQVQIQSLNPGFGPKLTLKSPSTLPPTTHSPTTQTFQELSRHYHYIYWNPTIVSFQSLIWSWKHIEYTLI